MRSSGRDDALNHGGRCSRRRSPRPCRRRAPTHRATFGLRVRGRRRAVRAPSPHPDRPTRARPASREALDRAPADHALRRLLCRYLAIRIFRCRVAADVTRSGVATMPPAASSHYQLTRRAWRLGSSGRSGAPARGAVRRTAPAQGGPRRSAGPPTARPRQRRAYFLGAVGGRSIAAPPRPRSRYLLDAGSATTSAASSPTSRPRRGPRRHPALLLEDHRPARTPRRGDRPRRRRHDRHAASSAS